MFMTSIQFGMHLSSFPLIQQLFLIEVFRSALSTVDKGQLEAAQSVGLTNFQAYQTDYYSTNFSCMLCQIFVRQQLI